MSHFSAARVVSIFIFATIAFGLYALLHTALVLYLSAHFGWQIGWLFWIFGVCSVLSFVVSHGRHNVFTSWFYRFGMLWMGLVVIGCLVIFPAWLASLIHIEVPIWIVLLTTGALAIGGILAATLPRVKTITLPIDGLKKPVTLIHISDVHIGEIYGPRYLRKLVTMANSKSPDVVVLTGDLFDGGGVMYKDMIDPVRGFSAPTLFITGNHEVYEGVYKTTHMVAEHGIVVLDDQIKTIAGIQFVGVSYPLDLGDDKHRTIVELAKRVDRKKPIVLLRHEPKRLDDATYLGADLMLCGHTHNGQIWPFNLIVKLFYEHAVGLHKKDQTMIYITPGAGTWGPPYRIGSRAEIVEFRLVPRKVNQ